MQDISAKDAELCDIIDVTEMEGGARIMPILTMQVPVDADAYYRGETLARNEGLSLYDKFNEWLDDYVEDAQLPVETLEALREAKDMIANGGGQEYGSAEEMFEAMGIRVNA